MTLTLKLENFDQLDNGSLAWITLNGHGASAGRSTSMDWVLPDATRHVSSHHFDIEFRDGSYWLTDVSTNGTFLLGQNHRLQGPLHLQGGERLIVGHYIIVAEVGNAITNAPQVSPTYTSRAEEADPWDLGVSPQAPVNPLPHRPEGARSFDDVAQDFMPMPPQAPSVAPPAPQPAPNVPAAEPGYPPVAPMPMPSPVVHQASPQGTPPNPTPQPVPTGGTAPAVPQAVPDQAILRAFCEGAGLDPDLAASANSEHLARIVGQALRHASDEIMRMLQDRASVKQFTKGGERTMRNAHGNNPLKFLPDSSEALNAMFLNPREGFMEGPQGVASAMADLRGHQQAVFAALQPALAAVLEGLSPEEIEAAEDSRALLSGSRRGKLWDSYVSRWDAKVSQADHGMLDVFLQAFAQAYSNAVQKEGNFG